MAVDLGDLGAAAEFFERAAPALAEHLRSVAEARVFASGDAAVLVHAADDRVLVAATTERALLDVLLTVPRDRTLLVHASPPWTAGALDVVIEGVPVGSDEDGLVVVRGTKRGSCPAGEPRRALAKGDPALGRVRDFLSAESGTAGPGFVAEGLLLVDRAVRDGLAVESVVYRSDQDGAELFAVLESAEAAGIPTYRCSAGLLGTITPSRPVPTVVAAVRSSVRDVATLAIAPTSVLLVAEALQNPDNLGMTLRTADAAGVDAVVVVAGHVHPFHRNCVRAARGAVGRLPLFVVADPVAWAAELRARGVRVVSTSAHAPDSLYEASLDPPVAVVVGNEERGVSPALAAACTDQVRIPMATGQSSLNVGVAAGIVLFEILRARRGG